jgi:hypothetical protein
LLVEVTAPVRASEAELLAFLDGERMRRVTNVAERGAWAVPLANWLLIGFRQQCQRGVDELARQIEGELRKWPWAERGARC